MRRPLFLTLVVSLGLACVVILRWLLPYSLALDIGLTFTERIMLVALIASLVVLSTQRIFPSHLKTAGASVASAIAFLAFDPYSHGLDGRARMNPEHPWQSVAAAALVLLLIGSALALRSRKISVAKVLSVLEFGAFVTLNAAFVFRDGFGGRLFVGDEEFPMSAALLTAGLAARAILQFQLFKPANDGMGFRPRPE